MSASTCCAAYAALALTPHWAAAAPAAVVMPETVVSATRGERQSNEVPAAIDTVPQAVIRDARPQIDLSETLPRVPGIAVLDRQNYAQDLQVSVRGFGARAPFGVRGVRLIADGIPATSPDGQAQTSSFLLSSVERIEVMRGPFSALYGNAAGGVIQIFTADGPPEPTLSGSGYAGSYGLYKVDAQLAGTQEAVNYRLSASRFHTDGFRAHSSATREQTNARLKIRLPTGRLTVALNTLDQPEAQDPLGLTRAQVAADRRQADARAILFNTRKSVAQSQGGLTYDLGIGARDALQLRAYVGDRQVTQYLAIPLAPQLAPTSSGGVVDLDRGYGGVGLRWMRTLIEGEREMLLTAGLDYDRQSEQRRGYVNRFGIAGELKRNEQDKVSNIDVYTQLEWRLASRWNATAGVRHSRVRFETEDRFIAPGNADDSGAVRFVKTLPVAGLVYRLTPEWRAYANIGRGFETPTFAELAYGGTGAGGLNFALRPAESLHREIGLKGRMGPGTRVDLALFHVNTTNEIVVEQSSGGRTVYANAPGTRRSGIEASWTAQLPAGFVAYASYTRLEAEFTQGYLSRDVAVRAGNALPGVPRYSWYGELLWRSDGGGVRAGLEARGAGAIQVNDANTEATDSYAVANVHVGFEQRGKRWRVTEFVRLNNVTGREYIGAVIVGDANGRYYEPAPARNYVVGATASLRF